MSSSPHTCSVLTICVISWLFFSGGVHARALRRNSNGISLFQRMIVKNVTQREEEDVRQIIEPKPSWNVSKFTTLNHKNFKLLRHSQDNARIMNIMKFMFGLGCCGIILLITLSWSWSSHRHAASGKMSNQSPPDGPTDEYTGFLVWLFNSTSRLYRPYFAGSTRKEATIYICFLVVLLGASVVVDAVYNLWEKVFWDLMHDKDSSLFARSLLAYAAITFAHTIVKVASGYACNILAMSWRDFQTRRLIQLWLSKHTHLVVRLQSEAAGEEIPDNPDQRIQEDVRTCASLFFEMTWDFSLHQCHMIYFGSLLIRAGPSDMLGIVHLRGWILYFIVIESFLASYAIEHVSKTMLFIKSELEKCEARFRKSLLRIHESSESIALYNASAIEETQANICLDKVTMMSNKEQQKLMTVDFFREPYHYLQWMLYVFLLAPSYFSGELSLGDVFMLSEAASHLGNALKWFLESNDSLQDYRVSADRVLELEASLKVALEEWDRFDVACSRSLGDHENGEAKNNAKRSGKSMDGHIAMRQARELVKNVDKPKDDMVENAAMIPAEEWPEANGGKASPHDDAYVISDPLQKANEANGQKTKPQIHCASIAAAQVCLPSGEIVWQDVRLQFTLGQHVLISGGEGQGKSILFKVAAGVWPYVKGCEVSIIGNAMFLPQNPVLPGRCSLREALAYPNSPDAFSDKALIHVLHEVGLEKLMYGINLAMEDDDEGDGEEEDANAEEGDEVNAMAEGKVGGLDMIRNWTSQLSAGMRQRLAFGQCILKKPKCIFLDEASSSMTKRSALQLYKSLYRNVPDALVVSISHDVDTMRLVHDIHYIILGTGKSKRLTQIHSSSEDDLAVDKARPGQFAAVLWHGEWNEVLLCASLVNHPNLWLSCTTDEEGTSFIWAVAEIVLGGAVLIQTTPEGRAASGMEDDEINWICCPPDNGGLWYPTPEMVKMLIEDAEKEVKHLIHVPMGSLEDAVAELQGPAVLLPCHTGT
eukprot:gnl/MRDRNA2_/MRDRNA2_87934_c0_seq1.p1 gnl/MRDRNA2_/MRDRNA2_87934_c0~~gnl/MRDRNA2_/MRDRNA2_87934_c0_seq1.p1  ORF type:complete len:990 (+),score=167.31 gnl/MRDRNA2_/MRDRNA2_87934_c0_seq1:77-3046(+)